MRDIVENVGHVPKVGRREHRVQQFSLSPVLGTGCRQHARAEEEFHVTVVGQMLGLQMGRTGHVLGRGQ